MAALVESGLRNLPYGDRDSVGLFQMRLSVWDHGRYEGYLARPELQLRWFVDRALAVQAARIAAGDDGLRRRPARRGASGSPTSSSPPGATAGATACASPRRRRCSPRPRTTLAPFELGLTVGGPALAVAPADELAQRVLGDDAHHARRARPRRPRGRPRRPAPVRRPARGRRARTDRRDRCCRPATPTSPSTARPSNHSFGRGADIGAVGGAPVDAPTPRRATLALALGSLPADMRPTEIGTPWQIDDPAYFTDGGHRDHLHIGFDDPLGAGRRPAEQASAPARCRSSCPPRRARAAPARPPAEPRFAAAPAASAQSAATGEPALRGGAMSARRIADRRCWRARLRAARSRPPRRRRRRAVCVRARAGGARDAAIEVDNQNATIDATADPIDVNNSDRAVPEPRRDRRSPAPRPTTR